MTPVQSSHCNIRTVACEKPFDVENSSAIYQLQSTDAFQMFHMEFAGSADIGRQATGTVRPHNRHTTARRQVLVENVPVNTREDAL